MNLNSYKYCCLSLIGVLFAAQSAIAAQPIENSSTARQGEVKVKKSVYISRNSQTREYTFKAPDSKTLSNSNLTAVQGYKVEIYGSAKDLLQEVRSVEPKAFIKGNIIQVGIFSKQNNAEDMVRKLAGKGFWARMVTQ